MCTQLSFTTVRTPLSRDTQGSIVTTTCLTYYYNGTCPIEACLEVRPTEPGDFSGTIEVSIGGRLHPLLACYQGTGFAFNLTLDFADHDYLVWGDACGATMQFLFRVLGESEKGFCGL